MNATNDEISALSFEAALKMLEDIVAKLEGGKVELEESIKIYERGEALKLHCEAKLREAEARIEKITFDAAGKPKGTAPLDVE
jgi:exodeoxyribonuclease VII small subunit